MYTSGIHCNTGDEVMRPRSDYLAWDYQSYVPNPEDGMDDDRRRMQEELENSRADDQYDADQAEKMDSDHE